MSVDVVDINGVMSSPENAKISVFDRGFLFGDAVYEVTRSYGMILFQLEAHVDRLFRSAEAIDMDLGYTRTEVIDKLYAVHKKVNKPNRYLRWQVTRGEGPIGMSMKLATKANWVIYVKDIDVVTDEQYRDGVTVVSSRRLRNAKQALDPNIKSGNYLNNVLAFKDATNAKAFESIMVNAKGHCVEGTTSNFFCVKKGVLLTSPANSDILQGITRSLVIEIARENGIKFTEAELTPEEVESSEEIFITSSTREVLGVSRFNNQKLEVGPVTKKLAELYKIKIKQYLEWAEQHHPWR